MDDDLIERLAREAGLWPEVVEYGPAITLPPEAQRAQAAVDAMLAAPYKAAVRRFAALMAEECAKIADDTATQLLPTGSFLSERCGAAIRAKFKEP